MLTEKQVSAVIELLALAGDEIMKVYSSDDFSVKIKDDNSPVTRADLASDEIIKTGLQSITPGINIFSEETKDIDYSERKLWNPLWILDPLDGTKEFVERNGEFCISLALVKDKLPIAAFIHAPVTSETWYSIRGQGAYLLCNGVKTRLPLVTKSNSALTVNISRNHFNSTEAAWIEKLKSTRQVDVISQGSAIKFCRIAEGKTDIYPKFGRIHEWDIAAGDLIVSESGGTVIETDRRQPPVYNKEDYMQPHFIAFGQGIKNYGNWF